MLLNLVLCLFLERANSQYDYPRRQYYIHNYPDQKDYYVSEEEYEVHQKRKNSGRSRKGHKDLARRWLKFPEYQDSTRLRPISKKPKCKCSCDRCNNLNPCCSSVCTNCNPNPGLILVPYPVPLIVYSTTTSKLNCYANQTTTTTITTTTTTTETTRTTKIATLKNTTPKPSTEPPILKYIGCPPTEERCLFLNKPYRKSYWEPYGSNQNRYHDNNGIVRPTLPDRNFVPKTNDLIHKYGIVPIPNHLAEKLMQNMDNNF